ncbi:MAG: cofactor-independent phosphoglycerate mutase [Actinomycetota bacterium]|nr:cofactor-independent phosphoglycerate mutase [Actinomycetota bacterium]
MKYIFLVPDGAADYPLRELGDKTPLQFANAPNMDSLAQRGIIGSVDTIPRGMNPGSDVANMSLLGYDPLKYHTGRGFFEAAQLGIELKEGEYAFRCNLITVLDDRIADYSAGHISSEEASELISALNDFFADDGLRFYPGLSYRHIMVSRGDFEGIDFTPPHDVVGGLVLDNLSQDPRVKHLNELMLSSKDALALHPINLKRQADGKRPANMIWLWGQGRAVDIPSFFDKFSLKGGVISAVDLIMGLGRSVGLKVIKVPGATGYLDTDYKAKGEHALRALADLDFIFVHVEAPDEAGHIGDAKAKVKAIEDFDEKVVETIVEGLAGSDFRLLIAPDHPTPVSVRTHTSEAVPFLVYDSTDEREGATSFDEAQAKRSPIKVTAGFKLMGELLSKGEPFAHR